MSTLKEKYELLQIANPKMRIRDAAKSLGTTEAELVHLGAQSKQLNVDPEKLLNQIQQLGKVMALTRNDNAVHERKGNYSEATFNNKVGLVVGPDIDLRLFMFNWKYVFAQTEGDRKSIQFFDKYGEAAHKIYLTEESNKEAFDRILFDYTQDKEEVLAIEPRPTLDDPEKPDHEIDIDNFQKEWLALQDTHNFFALLKKYEVKRLQAMRLAPDGYAASLPVTKIEEMLKAASADDIDIMVFIGNKNCIQIHTGKTKNIIRTGPWINVLDEEFSMHLRDEAISSVWLVKKPTNLGIVNSIEAYDAAGELVVQFFGKRKPDIPEREDWRTIIHKLGYDA